MAYIKARPNGGFFITVSCGRDTQEHKISKSVTFRPDPCTAKGHLKSENTIQREVKEYAVAFEKKVLLGQCIEGDSLTLEKYSERYLQDYATITQAPRTLENTRASIKQFNNDFGYMVLKNLNRDRCNVSHRKRQKSFWKCWKILWYISISPGRE